MIQTRSFMTTSERGGARGGGGSEGERVDI